jgi:hypothetical protein
MKEAKTTNAWRASEKSLCGFKLFPTAPSPLKFLPEAGLEGYAQAEA